MWILKFNKNQPRTIPMTEYTYYKVKQILENPNYPFSKGQLDHYIHNRHKNGLSKAIRKIGKRIYFRIDLFEQWIESQAEKSRGGNV